jgi:predicted membrane protein
MDSRRYLRRFFGSEWSRIFGPALGTFVLLGVGAALYTGDWSLPWLFAIIMIVILFRVVLIGVIFFWPIWIAIIMVWTGYRVLFKKKPKKESKETSANDEPPAGT